MPRSCRSSTSAEVPAEAGDTSAGGFPDRRTGHAAAGRKVWPGAKGGEVAPDRTAANGAARRACRCGVGPCAQLKSCWAGRMRGCVAMRCAAGLC